MSKLIDGFGRKHDYLRVSVIDRCNLRCVYCMGPGGIKNIPRRDILSYEEILEIIKCGAAMGISKIRLTGGEPLIRKNLLSLVEQIARIPAINDLSMTTNAILLPRYAQELKKAGLNRVNISLDTLDAAIYSKITRGGKIQDALNGIEAAQRYGLEPVKINVVLLKGYNEKDILHFIKMAREKNLHVRFIEYMKIGKHDKDYTRRYLPLSIVQEAAEVAGIALKQVRHPLGAGPAECYSFADDQSRGTIGLIHSISRHLCDSCNRLRLTADGRLKSCLYWQEEHYVRSALGNTVALQKLFLEALSRKHNRHQMGKEPGSGEDEPGHMRAMSRIGG